MGRNAKGPEKDFQYEDQQQKDATVRSAKDDDISEAEQIRRFVAYGLAMRAKLGPEWDEWHLQAESTDQPPS